MQGIEAGAFVIGQNGGAEILADIFELAVVMMAMVEREEHAACEIFLPKFRQGHQRIVGRSDDPQAFAEQRFHPEALAFDRHGRKQHVQLPRGQIRLLLRRNAFADEEAKIGIAFVEDLDDARHEIGAERRADAKSYRTGGASGNVIGRIGEVARTGNDRAGLRKQLAPAGCELHALGHAFE